MTYTYLRKLTKKEQFFKILDILVNSIIAGALIGIGGWAYLTVGKGLLGAIVFPIGLYLICKMRANLYTGKIGFLFQEDISVPYLAIVLVGNLIGATLLGLCYTWLCGPNTELIRGIYVTGYSGFLSSMEVLVKSIFCGTLVYLAIVLYRTEKSEFSKFLGVFLPIFVFVLCGFRHCIADIFYIFASQELTWQAFVTWLLAFGGNSIGALVLAQFYNI